MPMKSHSNQITEPIVEQGEEPRAGQNQVPHTRPLGYEPLTQVLLDTLRFIQKYTDEHHYPPVYREMLGPLGITSTHSAKTRVDRLRDRGLVTYRNHSCRSITLTEAGKELAR